MLIMMMQFIVLSHICDLDQCEEGDKRSICQSLFSYDRMGTIIFLYGVFKGSDFNSILFHFLTSSIVFLKELLTRGVICQMGVLHKTRSVFLCLLCSVLIHTVSHQIRFAGLLGFLPVGYRSNFLTLWLCEEVDSVMGSISQFEKKCFNRMYCYTLGQMFRHWY
jgi:hypothetical protein